jgi:glycosyltransferase involved in cell wall biosynthesis
VKLLFLHMFDLSLAGGSGAYLRALCAAFGKMGHQVEVMSARQPDRYGISRYQLPFSFPVTFGPERRDGERTLDELSVDQLRALAERTAAAVEEQALARQRPDLLLVNHISVLVAAAAYLQRRHAIPYRVITYGTDTQLLLHNATHIELYGAAAAQAERIFAISRFVADQVRDAIPDARVEVLGGAVDRAVFRPAPAEPERANRIAFVGRLVTEKGLWTLVAALSRLRTPAELDIVGEGPLLPALRERIAGARLPVQVQVNLLGYQPPERLREILVSSSLLVVPSTWPEPLGLVVLEAMACGVPVVASSVGGIPEMVRHDWNGMLVPPADPGALAHAINLVLGDPALRRWLREHCLHHTQISSYHDIAVKALR